MTDRPEPFTPPGLDLRDFPYLPLDVVRLRDSQLAGIADAEAFRASVLAWCVAWHQVPAASLPDDDAALARLLGFGRDVKAWRAVRKAGGLHGWIKCADGRLYHPVVAEKALIAEERREAQRSRTEAARQAAIRRRAEADEATARGGEVGAGGDDWPADGAPAAQPAPAEVVTDSVTGSDTDSATDPVTVDATDSKPSRVNGSQANLSHRQSSQASLAEAEGADGELPEANAGEAKPDETEGAKPKPAEAKAAATTGGGKPAKRGKGKLGKEMPHLRALLLAAAAAPENWPLLTRTNLEPIPKLIAEGHDLDLDVLPTVAALADAARHTRRPSVIASWQYFERSIRLARAERFAARRAAAASGAAAPRADAGEPPSLASRLFIPRRDPRFAGLLQRWRGEKGRDPPLIGGPGGPGWYFERLWILAGEVAAAGGPDTGTAASGPDTAPAGSGPDTTPAAGEGALPAKAGDSASDESPASC